MFDFGIKQTLNLKEQGAWIRSLIKQASKKCGVMLAEMISGASFVFLFHRETHSCGC